MNSVEAFMKKSFFLIVLLFVQNAWGQATLPEYFESLYTRHSPVYKKLKYEDYDKISKKFGLDKDNQQNQKNYFQILFFHDLFTGAFCIDFTSGGMLEIPYVFHWQKPNPRHSITYLSKSLPLSKVDPPKEFRRYKTYGDIDRIPSLYIGDLFSKEPKYYHPTCGKFYTFGWCSEREMAYNAVLAMSGYKCKIKQKGIHTWSEVWLVFKKTDGTSLNLSASIDNSIDRVDWKIIPKGINQKDWIKEWGAGTQIRWYNNVIKSEAEKKKLMQMTVSSDDTQWIDEKVKKWFSHSIKKEQVN